MEAHHVMQVQMADAEYDDFVRWRRTKARDSKRYG